MNRRKKVDKGEVTYLAKLANIANLLAFESVEV